MRQDTSLKDPDVLSATIFGKLEAQTALPDTSLTDDADDTTIAIYRMLEFRDQGRESVRSDLLEDLAVCRFEKLRLREHAEVLLP